LSKDNFALIEEVEKGKFGRIHILEVPQDLLLLFVVNNPEIATRNLFQP